MDNGGPGLGSQGQLRALRLKNRNFQYGSIQDNLQSMADRGGLMASADYAPRSVVTVHGINNRHTSQIFQTPSEQQNETLEQFAVDSYGIHRTTNFKYTPQPSYDILSTGIHDAAMELLNELKPGVQAGDIPSIVFIGHDLGGLIVKQALLIALEDEAYSSIAEKATVLVFIDTPHQTTRLESWQSIAAKLVLKGPYPSTNAFPTIIGSSPPVLEDISRRFRTISGLYSIISHYSSCGTSSQTLAFCKESMIMGSSTLTGDQDEYEFKLALETVFTIRALEEKENLTQLTETTMARTYPIKASYLNCLNTLSKLCQGPLPAVNAASDTLLGELLSNKAFKDWKERDNQLLWLQIPEESSVASSVSALRPKITQELPQASIIELSFHPHNETESSLRTMLASLSRQLLMLQPFLFSRVQNLYDGISLSSSLRADYLWAFFRSLLNCPGRENVVCFIHGVNQDDGQQKNLLKRLLGLYKPPDWKSSFKMVVFSPQAPDESFQDTSAVVISMGLNESKETTGQDARDKESIIKNEVSRLIQEKPEFSSFREILERKFTDSKTGEHISLIVDLLRAHRVPLLHDDIYADLTSLPYSLDEAFEYFLRKIPSDRLSWSNNMLSWVLFARRPLNVSELAVAAALHEMDHDGHEHEEHDGEPSSMLYLKSKIPKNLTLDLRRILGNLVIVRDGEVTLCHELFRRYLSRSTEHGSNISLHDDMALAERCIGYLTLISRECPQHEECVEEYSLLAYAKEYWARHYILGGHKISPKLRDTALAFLKNDCPRFEATSMDVVPYGNALLNAMALHCTDLVILLLEQDSNAIRNMNEAMTLAIELGNEAVVDVLISHHDALHKQAVLGRSLVEEALGLQTPEIVTPIPLLHTAAASGHCGIFSKLLAAGFDRDAKDDRGRTALHLASQFGHIGVLQQLRGQGAMIDSEDCEGSTPLHVACKWQQPDAVKELLDGGAKISAKDSGGKTALHLAAEAGCEDITGILLYHAMADGIHDAVTSTDNNSSTPLHLAARYGHDKVVDLILYEAFQSPTITTLPDKTKSTPLHLAVTGGHYNVVKRLIAPIKAMPMRCSSQVRGDYESSIEKCDEEGMLPIHLAVLSEDATIVQEICNEHIRRNRPIDTFDEHSKNALHVAASSGSVEIVRILLGTGAAPDITNANYQTPLLLACRKGFDEIVKLLLRAGANPMHTDDRNRSALHEAVEGGTSKMIETLLEVSQLLATEDELLATRDNDGSTPFHVAAKRGDVAIMKALLNHGKHLQFLGMRNIRGENPLHLASTAGNLDMVKFLIEQVQINTSRDKSDESASFPLIKVLLEVIPPLDDDDDSPAESNHFSDILKLLSTVQNVDRWSEDERKTILLLAVEKGMKEIVRKVTDPSKAHQYDETTKEALALAAQKGRADIVQWLVRSDIDKEKHYRRLAVTTAAEYGQLGVLESLVTSEGPGLANEICKDALAKAAEYGHSASVQFLLKNGDIPAPATDLSEALGKAIDSRNDEIVDSLLRYGAELPDSWTSTSVPLHRAVERGDEALCRRLLLARRLFLNERDSVGRTALFTACWYGRLPLVELLITEYKADPELADGDGWRPLHAAYDSPTITRYLIDAKVEIDAMEAQGRTALQIALERGFETTAEELLEGGANPLVADRFGDTSIHVAARKGVNIDLFRGLLRGLLKDDISRAWNLKNEEGTTPLMLAIMSDQREIVSDLVHNGHADITQEDEAGHTLLYTAIRTQSTEVVKYLFEKSCFSVGSSNTSDDVLRDLIAQQPNKELLVTLLKSEMRSDFDGDTLFQLAMHQEDKEIIDLVKSIQDLDDKVDEHGWSLAWLEHALLPIAERSSTQIRTLDSVHKLLTPSRWIESDISESLRLVNENGLVLSYANFPRWRPRYLFRASRRFEPYLILADHPIPPVGSYSFQMKILDEGEDCIIGIGFGTTRAPRDQMPGWDERSWGYHSDDGKAFHDAPEGKPYSVTYGKDDVIACHIDSSKGNAFFTKNGQNLGIAFENIMGRIFPIIGMQSPGASVETSFA